MDEKQDRERLSGAGQEGAGDRGSGGRSVKDLRAGRRAGEESGWHYVLPRLETLWPRSWHFCPSPCPAEPPPHTLALTPAQSAIPQPYLLCHTLVIFHCDLTPLLSLEMEFHQRPPHLSPSVYIYFFLLFPFFLHFCLLHSPISFLSPFSRPGCQSLGRQS